MPVRMTANGSELAHRPAAADEAPGVLRESGDALRRAELLYQFAQAAVSADRLEEIFDAALDAVGVAIGSDRGAILISDSGGVMRFRAWRSLSDSYRAAVEGHSPWPKDAVSPQPVLIPDAQTNPGLTSYAALFERERIGALAFIPLVSGGALIGKLMVYFDRPHQFDAHDVETTQAIANHLASVIARVEANVRLEETLYNNELFAGVLAHDLRNPLSAIVNLARAGLIREDSADTGILSRILSSAHRMGRMIDQLLDWTRARTVGRIEVFPRKANLSDLCTVAVAELEAAHARWKIERRDIGNQLGVWDPDRLVQIISNVVANAGEHGRPDGRIQITLDGMAEDVVRFEVTNSGAVPASLLPTLFDPLRRGRESRSPSRGLGLGLFIVRELVKSHGGTVEVRSSEKEDTTTVSIILPRAFDEDSSAVH